MATREQEILAKIPKMTSVYWEIEHQRRREDSARDMAREPLGKVGIDPDEIEADFAP